jgi:hypothetical protein
LINSSADKKFERVRKALLETFDFERRYLMQFLGKEISKLKLDANGMIANTPENMRIRAQILTNYRNSINTWIDETMAPRGFEYDRIPDTIAGQAAAFGRWYGNQGLKIHSPLKDMQVLENLQNSVRHVTSVATAQHDQLRTILTRGILTPGTRDSNPYQAIMTQIEETFLLKPNVAETVFRGTVMETFRMTNAAAASELKTDYFQHTGPPPRPMPNGHEFCIKHYGEIHSIDEWVEIAMRYEPQGGTDSQNVLEYVGGYKCRHGLRPVAVDAMEDARDDIDAYKEIQAVYKQELIEFGDDVENYP